jgi:hypothetical protein
MPLVFLKSLCVNWTALKKSNIAEDKSIAKSTFKKKGGGGLLWCRLHIQQDIPLLCMLHNETESVFQFHAPYSLFLTDRYMMISNICSPSASICHVVCKCLPERTCLLTSMHD